MFCTYCGLDHNEATPMSSEHVIPYAIGGSNDLRIEVCEASNNRLGGQVDRPIIEFFPVRSARFFLGLDGTDGTRPTLDFSGITYLQGREVEIRNVLGPDGKDMRLTGRELTRTKMENRERWDFSGSPDAIRKGLAGKIQDQASKGKWVKTAKGETLNLDNLDQFLQGSTEEIKNPCVLRRIDFDYLWTWRFFAKLALSMGHFVFGEEFSRSKRADEIRQTMNARNLDAAALAGAAIFPETHSLPPLFAQFKTKDVHTIVVTKGRPRFLGFSLFGWLDGYIALDDVQPPEGLLIIGDTVAFEITLPDRRLSRYSLREYLQVRALRKRPSQS